MCSSLGGDEVLRLPSGRVVSVLPGAARPVDVEAAAGRALDVHRDVGGVVVDRSDTPVRDQLVGTGDGARDQEHEQRVALLARGDEWQK